ncbi:MAG: YolD-like family protein [Lachnospiraceae bacterium]|nr:YolD-like family protein [Lachnospiraceae bacterium]
MRDYSDIMDHPHYRSKTRPHMSMTDRAAQFSPFAALSGYGEAVEETGRLTSDRVILDEDAKKDIDRKLQIIEREHPEVTVTFFVPDPVKDGGMYIPLTGYVRKIDTGRQKLTMEDETVIGFEDIFDISFYGSD